MSGLANEGLRGFSEACTQVMEFLQSRYGFGLWMITRVSGDNWKVIQSLDDSFGLRDGDLIQWIEESKLTSSISAIVPQMSDPLQIATKLNGDPITVRAYIIVPIFNRETQLYGHLVALDRRAHPAYLSAEQPMIDLIGSLVGRLIEQEIQAEASQREVLQLQIVAETDPLTSVANRRAWDHAIEFEEKRPVELGPESGIIVLDLDHLKEINDEKGHRAGDQYLILCAQVLQRVIKSPSLVARIGGDEFGILAFTTLNRSVERMAATIQSELSAAGVSASVGYCVRARGISMQECMNNADSFMYAQKSERRNSPPAA